MTQTSEGLPDFNLPGLSDLREAAANSLKQFPRPAKLRQDVIASVTSAIGNVPDGMANSLLVGVNPVYGLYANIMGPLVGGTLSSTQLMMVTTTGAAALAAGQALASVPDESRASALFTMVILIGGFQIVFGLLGMGKLTRFVSYSTMTGFLAGIAVLLILSQLPTITGYAAEGENKIAQTFDLLTHLNQINLTSLVLAIVTLMLVVVLPRTPVGNFTSLVAIAVPSLLVFLLGLDSVQIVQDVGDFPRGIPPLFIPSPGQFLNVVTGAFAVTAIILVQGAGACANLRGDPHTWRIDPRSCS